MIRHQGRSKMLVKEVHWLGFVKIVYTSIVKNTVISGTNYRRQQERGHRRTAAEDADVVEQNDKESDKNSDNLRQLSKQAQLVHHRQWLVQYVAKHVSVYECQITLCSTKQRWSRGTDSQHCHADPEHHCGTADKQLS